MKLTNVEKVLFTKHVSIMLRSGISIIDTLETLLEQSESAGFKKTVNNILNTIKNGQKLSEALAQNSKSFDRFYINLVRIGEESGTLSKNLEYLSTKLDKDFSLKKKIQGVILYPAIIVGASALMMIGLSIFILPKLSDLFSSLSVNLPLSTRILMWLSNVMKQYNILILVGLVVIIILFRLFISLPVIKPKWQRFLLSLPLIGPFIQNIEMASFTRNLGTMLCGGLTITSSLEIAADTTNNLIFKKYFISLKEAVTKGKSLISELNTKNYPKIPKIAVKMIGVGEKSGNLSEMLLYLGDFFEEELDNASKNFSTVLEPVLLLLVGLIVAFLALAIISPIYQLTGSINR